MLVGCVLTLVFVSIPLSFVKYKFLVPVLECLSFCQENR